MKRIIPFLLVVSFAFSNVACAKEESSEGNLNNIEESVEEIEETEEPVIELSALDFGKRAETDTISLIVKSAQLSDYYSLPATGTLDEWNTGKEHPTKDYFTVGENKDEVADVGHTFVVMELKYENFDSSPLNLKKDIFVVKYNGEEYSTITTYGCTSEKAIEWEKYSGNTIKLSVNEVIHCRCVIDIPVEVDSFSDSFELFVTLPNSDSEEVFRYVSSTSPFKPKDKGISLETAISDFAKDDGQKYFEDNMDEYKALTKSEIKDEIIGNKFSIIINGDGGLWEGKFEFMSDGNIRETIYDGSEGYFNNRTWTLSGDQIKLSSSKHTDTCEVLEVASGIYLFVVSGSPYAILY